MRVVRTTFRILGTAFRRLGDERGPEAAASMSFYAVFSLFPLLLLLVAGGSRVLVTADAHERLLDVVLRLIPVSRELVRQNVMDVVQARGAVGGVGVLGLAWAATSAFGTLVRNLNRAWRSGSSRNLFSERLFALAMVASLVGLVLLYLVARTLVSFPREWEAAHRTAAEFLDMLPSTAALFVFITIVLTLLYRWLPKAEVLWREAFAGAAACSLALWGATTLFTRFMAAGLTRYSLVYGSLGTLLALLSWVYIASLLILSGAHLAAAVAEHTRRAAVSAEDG
ncbi:MAG: YihY/virulence factor BrkB family protein [Candidatus Eisenbacteria bacterium]